MSEFALDVVVFFEAKPPLGKIAKTYPLDAALLRVPEQPSYCTRSHDITVAIFQVI